MHAQNRCKRMMRIWEEFGDYSIAAKMLFCVISVEIHLPGEIIFFSNMVWIAATVQM